MTTKRIYPPPSDEAPLPTRIHLPTTHILVTSTGRRIPANITDVRLLAILATKYTIIELPFLENKAVLS